MKQSEAIFIENQDNVYITDLTIDTEENVAVLVKRCNNVYISNIIVKSAKFKGIDVQSCNNVIITNCNVRKTRIGIYAHVCTNVKTINNFITGINTPNGKRGSCIQYDKVSGKGNEIRLNRMFNVERTSMVEDCISAWKTSGTKESPMIVSGNQIYGGSLSKFGGGIMTGDDGGGYINVFDNVLVNPGQYGIANAGAKNVSIYNNKVYSKQTTVSNVGIYGWGQDGFEIENLDIHSNIVDWTHFSGIKNNIYTRNVKNLINSAPNITDVELDESIIDIGIFKIIDI